MCAVAESKLIVALTDEQVQASANVATTFLRALFDERDCVLFRPIETWTEAGRKKSHVDYKHSCHRKAVPAVLQITLQDLLKLSAQERLNLFFGVCPRSGPGGRFDLAWQIRSVRSLWTDIDHVTVEEARDRIVKAGLPEPSIIVNSGNGVHLYWLLDEPYVIDDAGDPLPVETEWTQTPDGRKKPRKYIVENRDKTYLDQRRHINRLSPKAEHMQDVLAGIANAIGGDHTTDLARLLRIPGSMNRKDERNGREPAPTVLVACDPTRRYSISTFEALATPAPETEWAKKIAAMPLPRPRKISASKADKLAELIAASSIAPAGSRSEADFAICGYAIRQGIDKEEVWAKVEQVGKFAEQGRRYFDHTWGNAEFDTRVATFEKLQKDATPKDRHAPAAVVAHDTGSGGNAPPDGEEAGCRGRPTIVVDTATMPVAHTLSQVTDKLLAAGDCFIRTEQLVVINDQQITPILAPPELGGLLNQHVEFFFTDDDGGEYKPIPTSYAHIWLNQRVERARMPEIKLFTRNPVFTESWRLIGPGYDRESGIYYTGRAVEPLKGTAHLDALLQDFCFRSPADRTNYIGMLLTAILIPRFIGSKPAALFNGNQPGLGKSMLAQIISILRDGRPTETASYNANDEEFEKRLGAIVRRGTTTIIIDNAKGQGRKPRIESACLERSITDATLSFRLLGKSLEIRAENSHIFCITANTPDVSPDLVSRSVVINLEFEGDPKRRRFHVADPETYAEQHRLELLGELIGMVERWKTAGMPQASANTRFNKRGWGNIVGGVLETNGEPDFLGNAEEAAAQLDETRREFTELVAILAAHERNIWTGTELVEVCAYEKLLAADLGEGTPRSLSTKMGTLASRYIDERFGVPDGRQVVFRRSKDRKGSIYRVEVLESAEP